MGDLAEDRVYDTEAAKQVVFAASGLGVTVVETSGDTIGRFRLARDCTAVDLAGAGGWLAAATPEDVLACEVDADGEGEWVETGFGPAVAVGFDDGDLLAAGPDGELGRVVDVAADPTEWLAVADVDGEVRALDGPLVGASDGVYRFTPDGIVDVGLDDVRDVSAAGTPLAATGDGLFRLGNGWLRELDGPVDVVAGAGDDALERAYAAVDDRLFEFRGERDEAVEDDEGPAAAAPAWRERAVPYAPVVGVAYGERPYAVAADGTFLLDRGDGWAHQALGLSDPAGLATPR